MAHESGLEWTPLALNSLERVLARIAQDNPAAAQRFARTVKQKAEQLRQYPALGKAAHNKRRILLVHPNYQLTYRVTGQAVEILNIRHVARKPK